MNRQQTAVVINHGCKLNQCEGEALAEELEIRGLRVHRGGGWREQKPDLVIVNTCTVTARADRKSRNSVLRAVRSVSPGGRVIVTGCYAQTDPENLQYIPGVDLVVGGRDKANLVQAVAGQPGAGGPYWFSGGGTGSRSRAFLKIQDGCSMRCSYCKVPLARGDSVSRDPVEVLAAASDLVRQEYREIVLTGINLGAYLHGGTRLPGLLAAMLKELPRSFRVRLSSVEPIFFDDPLLELIRADRRIASHFHIPLQSGSDRILKKMRRPYNAERFLSLVELLREQRPDCHLAFDVMVGFPGEGREEFEQTVDVLQRARPASLHVFRYSQREHTDAAAMGDQVPYREKVRRSRRLIDMGDELNFRYRSRFRGSVLEGVVERHGEAGLCVTGNYIKVELSSGVSPSTAGCANAERGALPRDGDLVAVSLDRVYRSCTAGSVVGLPEVRR